MRRYFIIIPAFLLMISMWGCRTVGNLAVRNYSNQYSGSDEQVKLEAVPFTLNDSITHIYFRVPYNALSYKVSGNSRVSRALFKLQFEVYSNYESPLVIDSGTFVFADTLRTDRGLMFNFQFDVKAAKGQNYILSLTLNDLNRKRSINNAMIINRKTSGSSASFKASLAGGELIYSNILHDKNPITISVANTNLKSLWVQVFRRKFALAAPPFTMEARPRFDYTPDSSFQLQLVNGVSLPVILKQPGFYYFRSDTLRQEGFTLYRFSEGFPVFVKAGQMLGALRYITSSKEFEEMSKRPDTRSAVDSFWLATAGNEERALNLIKDYYSHVQRTNELFSSFIEGWQTDRGMIYIVMGPPNVVYRTNNQEEWIYGEAGNMRSMYFYFLKVENPFTNSDYILLRDPTLKQAWYMAVERWRR